eukprot:s419_g23.t1
MEAKSVDPIKWNEPSSAGRLECLITAGAVSKCGSDSMQDYDLLNKLDERVSKKTMARNAVEQLPRRLAKECECTQCGICLAEVGPKVQVAQLPCRHAFHPACISRWLTQCTLAEWSRESLMGIRKSSCPLCSTPLDEAPPRQSSGPASSSDGLQVCFL